MGEIHYFISIGTKNFIQAAGLKLVADADSKAASKIVSEAKGTGKAFSSVTKGQKRVSVIVMRDDRVYLTGYRSDTIAERMSDKGVRTLKVAPGIYIPTNIIKGVFDYGSTLATKLRTDRNGAAPNISLVRKTAKRRSAVLIDTGEVINIAPAPDSVVGKLEKAGKAGNSDDVKKVS